MPDLDKSPFSRSKHRTPVVRLSSSWNLLSPLLQVSGARTYVRNLAQDMQTQEWPAGCAQVTVPYDDNCIAKACNLLVSVFSRSVSLTVQGTVTIP